ncbi:hypothetical protein HELRODRAFT_194280 [Helobdella robusta]|uniref:Uncharacterized protein n=1 Tax=Helobdella robusta TaxID=6412 RepID=T1FVW2_HELRO|nr:hypothetical protein HELRODRAFT_194280 [Helobdella robusta]ESN92331.1 hypothetical protein HELRODRAFT_194280 [Helobdella robusta]
MSSTKSTSSWMSWTTDDLVMRRFQVLPELLIVGYLQSLFISLKGKIFKSKNDEEEEDDGHSKGRGDAVGDAVEIAKKILKNCLDVISSIKVCLDYLIAKDKKIKFIYIRSLLSCVLNVIQSSYIHCKESRGIYGDCMELVSNELSTLFKTINELARVCGIVSSLDRNATVNLWKFIVSVSCSEKHSYKLTALRFGYIVNVLCNDIKSFAREVASTDKTPQFDGKLVKFISFEMRSLVMMITECNNNNYNDENNKNDDEDGDDGPIKEPMKNVLDLISSIIVSTHLLIGRANDGKLFREQVTVAVEPLISYLGKDSKFADLIINSNNNNVSDCHDDDDGDESGGDNDDDGHEIFGRLIIILMMMRSYSSSPDWLAENSNGPIAERIISRFFSRFKKCQIYMDFPMKLGHSPNSDRPMGYMSLYEYSLSTVVTFIASLQCNVLKYLEVILLGNVLDYKHVYNAMLAMDIWCYINRFSPAEVCCKQFSTLLDLLKRMLTINNNNNENDDDDCVCGVDDDDGKGFDEEVDDYDRQLVSLRLLIKRLFRILPGNFQMSCMKNYSEILLPFVQMPLKPELNDLALRNYSIFCSEVEKWVLIGTNCDNNNKNNNNNKNVRSVLKIPQLNALLCNLMSVISVSTKKQNKMRIRLMSAIFNVISEVFTIFGEGNNNNNAGSSSSNAGSSSFGITNAEYEYEDVVLKILKMAATHLRVSSSSSLSTSSSSSSSSRLLQQHIKLHSEVLLVIRSLALYQFKTPRLISMTSFLIKTCLTCSVASYDPLPEQLAMEAFAHFARKTKNVDLIRQCVRDDGASCGDGFNGSDGLVMFIKKLNNKNDADDDDEDGPIKVLTFNMKRLKEKKKGDGKLRDGDDEREIIKEDDEDDEDDDDGAKIHGDDDDCGSGSAKTTMMMMMTEECQTDDDVIHLPVTMNILDNDSDKKNNNNNNLNNHNNSGGNDYKDGDERRKVVDKFFSNIEKSLVAVESLIGDGYKLNSDQRSYLASLSKTISKM